jgi:hypothetical protein
VHFTNRTWLHLSFLTLQASTQFAGYEGSDWGLTLWGLGAIGSPVTEGWLKVGHASSISGHGIMPYSNL